MKSLRAGLLLAVAVAVSGCAAFKTKAKAPEVPEEGRISLLAFDQRLIADPELAKRQPLVPSPIDLKEWTQPGGGPDNAPGNIVADSSLSIAWRESLGGSSRTGTPVGAADSS